MQDKPYVGSLTIYSRTVSGWMFCPLNTGNASLTPFLLSSFLPSSLPSSLLPSFLPFSFFPSFFLPSFLPFFPSLPPSLSLPSFLPFFLSPSLPPSPPRLFLSFLPSFLPFYRNLFSHSSGGYKSQIEMPANLVPTESSLPGCG